MFVYMYIGLAIKQVKSGMGIPPSRDLAGLVWKHLLDEVKGEILQEKNAWEHL